MKNEHNTTMSYTITPTPTESAKIKELANKIKVAPELILELIIAKGLALNTSPLASNEPLINLTKAPQLIDTHPEPATAHEFQSF